MNRRLLCPILATGLLAACGLEPKSKVSRDMALQLAVSESKQSGYDPERYKISIKYESKENQWVFSFESRSELPRLGGGYSVFVNAKDGKTTLVRGQ
jgi:hypothetical protein